MHKNIIHLVMKTVWVLDWRMHASSGRFCFVIPFYFSTKDFCPRCKGIYNSRLELPHVASWVAEGHRFHMHALRWTCRRVAELTLSSNNYLYIFFISNSLGSWGFFLSNLAWLVYSSRRTWMHVLVNKFIVLTIHDNYLFIKYNLY